MAGKVTIDIERIVRDAIIGYENTYIEVYKNTNDKEWLDDLIERRLFADKWLQDNGYAQEPMSDPVKKAVKQRNAVIANGLRVVLEGGAK